MEFALNIAADKQRLGELPIKLLNRLYRVSLNPKVYQHNIDICEETNRTQNNHKKVIDFVQVF